MSTAIDVDEIQHHIAILGRLLETDDATERRALYVDGFARFGPRFLTTLWFDSDFADDPAFHARMNPLREEASTVAAVWLNGATILGTADEDERRARFGVWMLDTGEVGLARLIARSILCLPESSPLRDLGKAREALMRYLAHVRAGEDHESELLVIGNLLEHEMLDDAEALELIAEGEAVVDSVDADEYGRDFLIHVFSYYLARGRGAATDAEAWRTRSRSTFERIAAIGATDVVRAKNVMLMALVQNDAGDEAGAADAFHRARSSGLLEEDAALLSAQIEARLRLRRGEDEAVVEILAPLVDAYEETYLTAVERSAVERAGATFGEVTIALAFANAALGRWKAAVAALEHGKSLRLRHQSALRRLPQGAALLELEEQLHALARHVEPASLAGRLDRKEDWIGAELSAQTRVLEEYRRTRAELPRHLVGRTELADIAGSLGDGEAALLFGLASRGTIVAGVLKGDGVAPSMTLLRPGLTLEWVGRQLIGENDDGFILAVEGGEELRDPRAPLDRLIAAIDRELGVPLASLLERRGLHRVVLVPHHFYDFVPLWALPSLARYEVVVVPSAAHFIAARKHAPRPLAKAVVVGNPTSDLPISPVEVAAVEHGIAGAGIDTTIVAAEEATEEALSRAVDGAGLFHFCGHGRAELTNPLRAGLLVRPEWTNGPVAGPDAFDRLIADVTEWRDIDAEHRETDIAGVGHLIEYRNSDNGELEFFLEYSTRGTLWARYGDGRRLQIAELWTAGDLMVQRCFEACELAFLSACSTGSGGIADIERGGLPGALLLAGVSTIVATQWPVSDLLSALFVDLFYAGLAGSRGTRSVAAIVREAANTLRGMSRDEVVARMEVLRQRVDDVLVEFEIDAYEQTIASGEERPFEHPYAWASFHVLGRGDVMLAQEE